MTKTQSPEMQLLWLLARQPSLPQPTGGLVWLKSNLLIVQLCRKHLVNSAQTEHEAKVVFITAKCTQIVTVKELRSVYNCQVITVAWFFTRHSVYLASGVSVCVSVSANMHYSVQQRRIQECALGGRPLLSPPLSSPFLPSPLPVSYTHLTLPTNREV